MFYGKKKASELTPEQHDAFVKHYFLKQGVKPSEVDKMNASLVNNLMELRVMESDKAKFKDMEAQSKVRLNEWLNDNRPTPIPK